MHYAEFAEDEVSKSKGGQAPVLDAEAQQSQALLNAIKEYEASKWKVIGAKVGKPAKVSSSALFVVAFLTSLLGLRAVCKRAFQQRTNRRQRIRKRRI